jgi:hypothetical protein
MRRGIPTWEQTLDSILPPVEKTERAEPLIQEINIEEIVQ